MDSIKVTFFIAQRLKCLTAEFAFVFAVTGLRKSLSIAGSDFKIRYPSSFIYINDDFFRFMFNVQFRLKKIMKIKSNDMETKINNIHRNEIV